MAKRLAILFLVIAFVAVSCQRGWAQAPVELYFTAPFVPNSDEETAQTKSGLRSMDSLGGNQKPLARGFSASGVAVDRRGAVYYGRHVGGSPPRTEIWKRTVTGTNIYAGATLVRPSPLNNVDIAIGPNNEVYVSSGSGIWKLDDSGGNATSIGISLPAEYAISSVIWGLASDSQGRLYFGVFQTGGSGQSFDFRLMRAAPGQLAVDLGSILQIAQNHGSFSSLYQLDIAVVNDQKIYFTFPAIIHDGEVDQGRIGCLDLSDNSQTWRSVAAFDGDPAGICATADGEVYFGVMRSPFNHEIVRLSDLRSIAYHESPEGSLDLGAHTLDLASRSYSTYLLAVGVNWDIQYRLVETEESEFVISKGIAGEADADAVADAFEDFPGVYVDKLIFDANDDTGDPVLALCQRIDEISDRISRFENFIFYLSTHATYNKEYDLFDGKDLGMVHPDDEPWQERFISQILRQDNSVSTYLIGKMQPETRIAIHEDVRTPQPGYVARLARAEGLLLRDLNSILSGPSLWDAGAFANISPRQTTLSLLTTPLGEPDLILGNRLLLEDSYPDHIERSMISSASGGHGGERPVNPHESSSGLLVQANSYSDEFFDLKRSSDGGTEKRFLSDDKFANLFRTNANWRGIDKFFILDVCYAGGFWGDQSHTNEFESGDLSTLSRSAVIGAVAEPYLTGSSKELETLGRGLFTLNLVKALNELKGEDYIHVNELHEHILQHYRMQNSGNPESFIEWGDAAFLRVSPSIPVTDIGILMPMTNVPNLYSTDDFQLAFKNEISASISSPKGYGSRNFNQPTNRLIYRINFQNREGAPIERLAVSNQLPVGLNWNTFRFEAIEVAGTRVDLSATQTNGIVTNIPIASNGTEVIEFQGNFDTNTGELLAEFTVRDVVTGELIASDVNQWLVSPDSSSRSGSLSYSVHPISSLFTGAEIRNSASVGFDPHKGGYVFRTDLLDPDNPSSGIDTNRQALVTIDAEAPSSGVRSLPSVATNYSFTVSWSSEDLSADQRHEGSGTAFYEVYYWTEEDGYVPWILTADTEAVFHGERNRKYRFRVQATDNVGNRADSYTPSDFITTPPNSIPVLTCPHEIEVHEGSSVVVTNSLFDLDGTNQTYRFSLINGPKGMAVNAATGEINWTPTEEQGPGEHRAYVQVEDSYLLPGKDVAEIAFNVVEVNAEPSLTYPNDNTVLAGQVVRISPTVADSDAPANGYEFGLLDAPSNVRVDRATGDLLWIPNLSDAGQHEISVRFADRNAEPIHLSTNLVNITVLAPALISDLQDVVLEQGQSVTLSANLEDENSWSVRWERNGVRIPGAANTTLALAEMDMGGYTLVVSAGTNELLRTRTALVSLNPPTGSGDFSLSTNLVVMSRNSGEIAVPDFASWNNGFTPSVVVLDDYDTNLFFAPPVLGLDGTLRLQGRTNLTGATSVRVTATQGAVSQTNHFAVRVTESELPPALQLNESAFNGTHTDTGDLFGELRVWGLYYEDDQRLLTNRMVIPDVGTNLFRTVKGDAGIFIGLAQDGRLWSWGETRYGKLGNSDESQQFSGPKVVEGLSGIVDFDSNEIESWACDQDGQLWAWGLFNSFSELSVFESPTPVLVPGISNIVRVSVGVAPILLNHNGEVFRTVSDTSGVQYFEPVLSNVVEIAGSSSHSIALDKDGYIWVWGRSPRGQLGLGTNSSDILFPPVRLPGISNIVQVATSARATHSLAVDRSGSVWQWGRGAYLGDNIYTVNTNRPVLVTGISNVVKVATIQSVSLAVDEDAQVWGWGLGGGALGEFVDKAPAPIKLDGFTNFVDVACSGNGSVGSPGEVGGSSAGIVSERISHEELLSIDVIEDSGLTNISGLFRNFPSDCLDLNVSTDKPDLFRIPPTVSKDGQIWFEFAKDLSGTAIVTVQGNFTGTTNSSSIRFALTSVPSNDRPGIRVHPNQLDVLEGQGQVEIPGFVRRSDHPPDDEKLESIEFGIWGGTGLNFVERPSLDGAGQLSFSLAENAFGSTTAWGFAFDGTDYSTGATNQFAINVIPVNDAPSFTLLNSNGVRQVAAGKYHNLAVSRSGRVTAWGGNSHGESDVPEGLTDVVQVAAGNFFSLARKSDGSVVGWGEREGGTPPDLDDVVTIAADGRHAIALRQNGSLVAWGDDYYGQANVPSSASNVVSLACGESHTLALRSDGTVVAWGRNTHGQCDVPSYVSGVVEVAAGDNFSLARTQWGSVYAWGENASGQTDVPLGLNEVIQISAGASHGIAFHRDGSVTGWGSNESKQLDTPRGLSGLVGLAAGGFHTIGFKNDGSLVVWGDDFESAGLQSKRVRNAASASVGDGNRFIVHRDGSVAGWGSNLNGKSDPPSNVTNAVAISAASTHTIALLGDGTVAEWRQIENPPVVTNAVAVAAGANISIALTEDGRVISWGAGTWDYGPPDPFLTNVVAIAAFGNRSFTVNNAGVVSGWGDLGLAGLEHDRFPSELTNVVSISSGVHHNIALRGDGTVVAWGGWLAGDLIKVPEGLSNVVQIAAGWNHSLALRDDGSVVIWGDPDNTTSPAGLLVPPPGLTNIVQIAAGNNESWAIRADGTAIAWPDPFLGHNICPPQVRGEVVAFGGNETGQREVPAPVFDVVEIAAGGGHNLALLANGKVLAWGDGSAGQTDTPPMLTDVVQVAAGFQFSLAVRSNGTVFAFGDNQSGQLAVPNDLRDVAKVSAGYTHSLALTTEGKVAAWGSNSDQQTYVPWSVKTRGDIIDIAAGGRHSVALRSNGLVEIWGRNQDRTPAEVPEGLSNVVDVAAGIFHTLALKSDGTVVAWGDNSSGQSTVPAGLSNIVSVAAGWYHSLALDGEGNAFAWGDDYNGQSSVPKNLGKVVSISGGLDHTVVLVGRPRSVSLQPAFDLQSVGSFLTDIYHGPPNEWDQNLSASIQVANPGAFTRLPQLEQDGSLSLQLSSNAFGKQSIQITLSDDGGTANGGTDRTTATFELDTRRVADPVNIILEPIDVVVAPGASAQFSVAANGSPPVVFQWYKDRTNAIAGETNSSLNFASAQLENLGEYHVQVSNPAGSVDSDIVRLVLLAPPSVTKQPTNILISALQNAEFNVEVLGSGPMTYQWWHENSIIAGANSTSLLISSVSTNDSGYYSLVASNFQGSVTSAPALLTVGKLMPTISWSTPESIVYGTQIGQAQQNASANVSGQFAYSLGPGSLVRVPGRNMRAYFTPENSAVYEKATASVYLAVSPKPLLITARSQQREYGHTNAPLVADYVGFLPGHGPAVLSTQPTLTTVAEPSSPLGSYPIVVTGGSAANYSIARQNGNLTVFADPVVINTQPTNQVVREGENASFNVLVSGTDPIQYQWYSGHTNKVLSATNSALILTNVQLSSPRDYWVAVTNIRGSVTSTVAQLTILLPPQITVQPTNQTVDALQAVSFTADATGSLPLHYQWRLRGDNLPGQTNKTLSFAAVHADLAGSIDVVVTNNAGSTISSPAILTVHHIDPGLSWNSPLAIGYGTPLGTDQLNASADTSGTFTYNPTNGAILPAGTNVLSVSFDPDDLTVYEPKNFSRPLVVNLASLVVTAEDKSREVGRTNPVLTVRFEGFVNGENHNVLATPPIPVTTADSNSPPGNYPITVGGASATNYSINYGNGVLSVFAVSPVLAAIGDQTVNEGQTFSVTAQTSGSGYPARVLVYSLPVKPAGMSINPSTGIITWITSETTGPSTNNVTVRVTDDRDATLADERSFTVVVNEQNNAPVLAAIGNQTINEGQSLNPLVRATDIDMPTNTLSFSLPVRPSGMTIDSAGRISWNTSESTGPSTNAVTVRVNDNGSPPLADEQTFLVVVNEVNSAPVLAPLADVSVAEFETLKLTNVFSDVDLPANQLTFSFVGNVPAGAQLTPDNGIFTWTPSEADGPGIVTVGMMVTDNGNPSLSATQEVAVTVREVNRPPVLAAIANSSLDEGQNFNLNLEGSDPDVPANQLRYRLVTGPVGMTIVADTGALSWAPTESQGPSTNMVTVEVSDTRSPPLTAQRSFAVVVREVNTAPMLAAVGNQNVDELTPLTLALTGNDTDQPTNHLSFQLLNGPAGMNVVAGTGALSWSPTEEQGPGIYPVTVRVFDDGIPSLSSTQSFSVSVGEVNVKPTLAAVSRKTIKELNTLSFTLSASDPDTPVNQLAYSLVSGPAGVSVNADGKFSWTPTAVQGPATYTITVRVTDDGIPNLSDTHAFEVEVTENNSSPVLSTIGNQVIDEGESFSLDVSATDNDFPTNVLTFSLIGQPDGMTIDSRTGLIQWNTDESDGPSTNFVKVRVADDATPALTDEHTFSLVVREVNQAPALDAFAPIAMDEQTSLSVTSLVSDIDIPTNQLTFTLAGAPLAGVSLDADNGILSWTPSESQGAGTYQIPIVVTDNGFPALSATQEVTVTVLEVNRSPALASIAAQTLIEGLDLVVDPVGSDPDLPTNTLHYSLVSGPPGLTVDAGTGRIRWTPTELQGPTNTTVELRLRDGGTPELSVTQSFSVTVLETNSAPVLALVNNQSVDEHQSLRLTLSGDDSDLPPNQLVYSLVSGPQGMTVASATGLLEWLVPEEAGGTTVNVRVRVSDNGSPPRHAERVFAVNVNEVNAAPQLPLVTQMTIREGTTLDFQLSASDTDIPENLLSFDVVGAPAGVVISPSGRFAWTPTIAQGPSTNEVRFRVMDNGVPPMSATQTVSVVVTEHNSAPVLAAIGNRTINEGDTFNLTVAATDKDIPKNDLVFSLTAHPGGMTIDSSSGAISWTSSESDGPMTNFVTVRVSDNGEPSLSNELTFTLFVNEVNERPILQPISALVVDEMATLTFTNLATDIDQPTNSLTYSVVDSPVSGVVMDSAEGILSWMPNESHGGNTYEIPVVVTDSGFPPLSATQFVQVVVQEVNRAPNLLSINNRTATEGELMQFTVNGFDSDIPANALTYEKVSGPAGINLHPTSGILNWMPDESDGGNTFPVAIRVFDNGSPPLSATQTFNVTVLEMNTAPTLPVLVDYTISETNSLSLTITANDLDDPTNTLAYSLVTGPTGMTIGANDGVLAWSPGEEDGGSNYPIRVRVTDNGTPAKSVEGTFTVNVTEHNQAPTLIGMTNRTAVELATLNFQLNANDADRPANQLSYLMVSGPTGAVLTGSGKFTWMPTEAQGPSTNTVTVQVADNGGPALTDVATFAIVVAEDNQSPRLELIPDRSVDEADSVVVSARGSDDDLPAQGLTYSLTQAPVGMTIHPTSGLILWGTSESSGPSINTVTVRVTDDGPGNHFAERSFHVTVREVNGPPTIFNAVNRNVAEGSELAFTFNVTDPDQPTNEVNLRFEGAVPAGVQLNSASREFSWTPTEAQGPSNHVFTVVAQDNGIPSISVTQTFNVAVSEVNIAPTFAAIGDQSVDAGNNLVLSMAGLVNDMDLPANLFTYELLSAPLGMTLGSQNGVVDWTPSVAQTGNHPIQLRVVDNGTPSLSATQTFNVQVNALVRPPLNVRYENGTILMMWPSQPGRSYRIRFAPTVLTSTNLWQSLAGDVVATTNRAQKTDGTINGVGKRFYRLEVLP